jgi:hypothetical protein
VFVLVELKTGDAHPQTYFWSRAFFPSNRNVQKAEAERFIQVATGLATKEWRQGNEMNAGSSSVIMEMPTFVVIWREWVENEFGLEIP